MIPKAPHLGQSLMIPKAHDLPKTLPQAYDMAYMAYDVWRMTYAV